MASKKDNIKALFSNARSRVIIIITFTLMLMMVIFGMVNFFYKTSIQSNSGASVASAPSSIQSVPGVLNQNAIYANLQETQNIQQAEAAAKSGNSSIPTIITTQAFGDGVNMIGPQDGSGGVGFQTLARDQFGGMKKDLYYSTLKQGNCSALSIKQVKTAGAKIADIRKVCSCAQLQVNGYKLDELKSVCACKELKKLGFTALDMKNNGYSAKDLYFCGYSACEEKSAGFTVQDLKDAGFSDGELLGAGFSPLDIKRASGIPDGMSLKDIQVTGCDAQKLKNLRQAGVPANVIRRISGCGPQDLIKAGYTLHDLKTAGFSAAELKAAGFSPQDMTQAGYSPRDLLNAGFLPKDLTFAGFSAEQIADAEKILPPGITAENIKTTGCDPAALKRELNAGVSAYLIHKNAACDVASLQKAGFSVAEINRAGFTPAELAQAQVTDAAVLAAGCDPAKIATLKNQGLSVARIHRLTTCSAAVLKAAGFSAEDLADAGFTKQQMTDAGFNAQEIADALAGNSAADKAIKAQGCDPAKLTQLQKQGVSAAKIHRLNGCSAALLKAAGFVLSDLADSGFSPKDLLAAGFSPEAVNQMIQGSDAVIKAAGCDVNKLIQLQAQGYTAAKIRATSACTLDALKAAGFSVKSLADAGFTPAELLKAGFTPVQLNQAGLNPNAVIAAGRINNCSPDSLIAAQKMGVSPEVIRQTLGCSASALKAAGYTALQLKNAGFTPAELRHAGFDPLALKNAGFSPSEIGAAGFTIQELKAAGYTAKQLKEAGFTAAELKAVGFAANQLKDAGFNAEQLKEVGFSAAELKNAGFSAKQLKRAGFNAAALKDAGFSNGVLEALGMDPNALGTQQQSTVQNQDPSTMPALPIMSNGGVPSSLNTIPSISSNQDSKKIDIAANNKQLNAILKQQAKQIAAQKYQQKVQQRSNAMLAAANQGMQSWKVKASQSFVGGSQQTAAASAMGQAAAAAAATAAANQKAAIKTGDIMFAVIDTAVNSDEPGPILATIVSGTFEGAKLIGSFHLANNANKMTINFNTLTIPGAEKSTSIQAFAIDPNTARTALASETNHHYLSRYGSLFASTFMQGFGAAFQSANTTVSVGSGSSGGSTTTVQNGIGRSSLDNAVIAMGTVGQSFGQQAALGFSRPTTVQVYSGTGVGVLFTQNVVIS